MTPREGSPTAQMLRLVHDPFKKRSGAATGPYAQADMRMDPTSGGMTAADLINSIPQMVLEEGLRVVCLG